MTKHLEAAIDAARGLSDEEQDELAAVMNLFMADDGESLLTPEQEAEVERRLADPNRTFVPAEEVFERLRKRFG